MQMDLLQESLFSEPQDNHLPSSTTPEAYETTNAQTSDLFYNIPLKPRQTSLHVVAPPDKLASEFTPTRAQTKHERAKENHHLEKAPDAFKTISEVASFLGVPQHVLRFWESRFAQIKPLKLAGGRRYYRPDDIEILSTIKHLLYKQGYTIKGAKIAFSLLKKSKAKLPEEMIAQKVAPLPEITSRVFNKKQISQLSGLREELINLRATLAPLLH